MKEHKIQSRGCNIRILKTLDTLNMLRLKVLAQLVIHSDENQCHSSTHNTILLANLPSLTFVRDCF